MPPRRPRRPLPPRRFPQRNAAPRHVHPLLLRANRLFSDGKYYDAAKLYEKLAVGAYDRHLPRAPMLFMQAGKSLLIAGKVEKGMALAQRGLGLLADQKRWRELYQFGRRSVNVLNELGHKEQAAGLEEWLKALLPEDQEPVMRKEQLTKEEMRVFPVSCPACGARVHPDEVKVIDKATVECSFCGSLIRSK